MHSATRRRRSGRSWREDRRRPHRCGWVPPSGRLRRHEQRRADERAVYPEPEFVRFLKIRYFMVDAEFYSLTLL